MGVLRSLGVVLKFGLCGGILVVAALWCEGRGQSQPAPSPEGGASITGEVAHAGANVVDARMVATDDIGCGAQLDHTPPHDLYRALTHGSADERATAALYIVQNRTSSSRSLVRRAIAVIAQKPYCPHLRPLTDTLEDVHLDDLTRAAAAASLGMIARDFPCTFPGGTCPRPHDPIPSWSQHALRTCARGKEVVVARACAEALGYVKTADINELVAIRDDVHADTMLRIAAGRSLSRLIKIKGVTADLLNKLVVDAKKVSAQ